ncbi:hypothetical protein CFC21_004777 [Triticum aestivum]|uniref:Dirigent protein n=2 Tax=Triticum aestivum TaxID=4565 RepID=A0A3B5YRE3_WHEAT|nr:myrosinase-binding protein 2-like [Triticum aestivum]KAF6987097.1 hypothetical protein CFC21_004777 [Triticum aestivum]
MAATNPSYYQSGVCQDIKQKEHLFHLYMNQIFDGPGVTNANQVSVVNPPGQLFGFGHTIANDWTIRDGPAANANLVARARGMHMGAGKVDENWLFCHNILFTDTRFKGSSLKVLGDFVGNNSEWAIVGGSGEFAYAQGVVVAKVIQTVPPTPGRTWELRISAFCLCIPKAIPVTKMGPWGGDGGTSFDITELPRSLQTVTIRCGDVINSVMFSYTDQTGQKKTAGPWGGDGALTATITLAPSEFIKQVLGTTGAVGGETIVTSLTLVSNVTTYGPFGKANGTPFSSQVPDGNNIGGFYARAGGSVNALGIYACPI